MSHKSTLPNSSIGLNSSNIADSNINEALWKYVATHHLADGLTGTPLKQAHIPKGTVDNAIRLRKAILNLSLAPDIYENRHLVLQNPNRMG